MAINLLIADDHKMVREALRELLESDSDVVVVGEANDGFECLNIANKIKPNVILLDIDLPNLDGVQTLTIMKQQKMMSKVIMLTHHKEPEFVLESIEAGCDGFVLKDSDFDVLKRAIYKVYSGDTYIEPSMEKVLNISLNERNKMKDKLDELTKRELEVLKMIASGCFNKEIAEKLNISERTVKNHVSNIFRKIGVSDRTQAAVFAIKNNIIQL